MLCIILSEYFAKYAAGGTITELSKFYYGYTFSWFGGFVDGFIVGAALAWLYNDLSSKI
jgi:hypothetical protein